MPSYCRQDHSSSKEEEEAETKVCSKADGLEGKSNFRTWKSASASWRTTHFPVVSFSAPTVFAQSDKGKYYFVKGPLSEEPTFQLEFDAKKRENGLLPVLDKFKVLRTDGKFFLAQKAPRRTPQTLGVLAGRVAVPADH